MIFIILKTCFITNQIWKESNKITTVIVFQLKKDGKILLYTKRDIPQITFDLEITWPITIYFLAFVARLPSCINNHVFAFSSETRYDVMKLGPNEHLSFGIRIYISEGPDPRDYGVGSNSKNYVLILIKLGHNDKPVVRISIYTSGCLIFSWELQMTVKALWASYYCSFAISDTFLQAEKSKRMKPRLLKEAQGFLEEKRTILSTSMYIYGRSRIIN